MDKSQFVCKHYGCVNKARSLAIALLSLLILALLWQRQRPAPEDAPRRTPPHGSVSHRETPASAKPATPAPAVVTKTQMPIVKAPPQAPPGQERRKPPEGSVPYAYANGWVTAYGDILLGKPKDPDFAPSGYIEAPKLNLWPRGIVPFSIHESLPNPERVMRVIAYMNEFTPVRFVAYSGQSDSIVFFPMDGLCVSYLGKIGGNQPIYLDTRCSDHEILHELMHALGFIHEHSRADRDQYVRVLWNNIEPDKLDQFDVTPPALNEPMKGRPFDYNSVMIYSGTAFARENGATTLQSLSSTQNIAPAGAGLSGEDMERLRLLYGR